MSTLFRNQVLLPVLALAMTACSTVNTAPISSFSAAQLSPTTSFTRDLAELPPPKGKIVAAVYGFKDQTGQTRASPDIYSTAVTQGGASLLVKALRDSKWFIPVERENLNDILTERKLIRQEPGAGDVKLPGLLGASLVIEGAIVGYDSNIKTGGAGAKYLGLSLSNQYRADQVTVNLRAVDINTGKILHTVSTTKTVYSVQVGAGLYKFVKYKTLLETEVGMTLNEPAQIAVQEAIESAVVNLVVEGIDAHSWSLAKAEDLHSPVLERYRDQRQRRMDDALDPAAQSLAEAQPDDDSAFATRKQPARTVLPATTAQQKKKKKKKPVAGEPASTSPAFGFDE